MRQCIDRRIAKRRAGTRSTRPAVGGSAGAPGTRRQAPRLVNLPLLDCQETGFRGTLSGRDCRYFWARYGRPPWRPARGAPMIGYAQCSQRKEQLEGKVALVTGTASGIGLAATRLFCGEGARVQLTDIRGAQVTAAAAAHDVTVEQRWHHPRQEY